MKSELKIGIIGLDTSHVIGFTQLLNDPAHAHHVPGAKVISAFAGGSPDFDLSRDRVEGFTRQIVDEYGVELMDSPVEVARACDAVLLTSVDGRVHLEQFRALSGEGKPVFIDKPFAITSSDARQISELATRHEVPLMSSSALRYAAPLVEALAEEIPVLGADCSGPMDLQPTQPGLFWYGIHSVEILYAAMGPGCRRVTAVSTPNSEFVTGEWQDGRIGTVRGFRGSQRGFQAVLHGPKTSRHIVLGAHPKPADAGLLEAVMRFFHTRVPAVPIAETLEIIRFIEAANSSRESGEPVEL